jgi:hypothetical protein
VQFVPPATPTSLPAITATYAGDATHKGSSGQTHYGTTGELATHVELSELGTIKPGGEVEVPVGCGFPCVLSGEISSPPGGSLASASLSSLEAVTSSHGKKKKKKRKPVTLGKGTLKLSKGGKGTLKIKLTAKGKHALAHVKGKGVRVTLKVTISTLDGRLVTIETKRLKVVPVKKKAHRKHH